jgi:hypothetical protein
VVRMNVEEVGAVARFGGGRQHGGAVRWRGWLYEQAVGGAGGARRRSGKRRQSRWRKRRR